MLPLSRSAVSMRVLNTGPFFHGTSYPQAICATARPHPSPVATMSGTTDEGNASARGGAAGASGAAGPSSNSDSRAAAPQRASCASRVRATCTAPGASAGANRCAS